MKKLPYVKNSNGLHYVNEKHCCCGKNSPEDDTKDKGIFFSKMATPGKLHFNLILLLVDLAFENYAQKYLQHNYWCMFYKIFISDRKELGMTSLLDRDLVRLNRNGHWGWRLHFCWFILYVLIIKKWPQACLILYVNNCQHFSLLCFFYL